MGSRLINAADAAYTAMADFYADDWAALEARNEGFYVGAGLGLSANASTLASVTTTIATSLLNKTAHGLVAGDTITLSGIATTTGITNGTLYYVSATGLTANAFRVAATSGGTAITFGGTADSAITVTQVGKLDMASGVVVRGTIDLGAPAQTAISTTIASLADATNPKWVAVELDASNVVQFNQGTAAATPGKPALTANRVLLGWLYIPATATAVDALLSTANGKAKLIDARQLVPGPSPTGWQYDQNTWTFVSSTTGAGGGLITFKVVGVNVTGYLKPGTKVRWDDGTNTPGYGVIATSTFSTDTTITLVMQSDYVMANATIKYPCYSYQDRPQGFPTWFNWNPTLSGWSSNPSNATYQWCPLGGTSVTINIRQTTSGTSNNATHTITLPVAAITLTNGGWAAGAIALDNAVVATGQLLIVSAGTTVSCRGTALGTNTASGTSLISGQVTYPF